MALKASISPLKTLAGPVISVTFKPDTFATQPLGEILPFKMTIGPVLRKAFSIG